MIPLWMDGAIHKAVKKINARVMIRFLNSYMTLPTQKNLLWNNLRPY